MRLALAASLVLLSAQMSVSRPADGSDVNSSNRQLVVTIDDLPAQRNQGLSQERVQILTDSLLSSLEQYRVPAIGFVNEDKLYADGRLRPDRVALLERWLDRGIELGNHSFSHPDLHKTPLARFQADVLRGETITRPLAEAREMPYRAFRHPFLHTGLDLETKASVEEFLEQHGYLVAPVTIDNSEWIFARAFDEALDLADPELGRRLGAEYLKYMLAMVAYYEDQSRGLFDREIPQILLLHANDLNARYLGPLLSALKERGYRFIDLETALKDDAYRSADTYVGPGGITWLHRWALTRGVESGFFRGEPTTAQWVQDLAGFEE